MGLYRVAASQLTFEKQGLPLQAGCTWHLLSLLYSHVCSDNNNNNNNNTMMLMMIMLESNSLLFTPHVAPS